LHIAFLLVILLLVFGAKRLPEMGHSLGSGLRGFKDSLSGESHTTQLDSGLDATSLAHHADANVAERETERTPVGPVA
jgi:sec-independent protein translocase protein TatA